MVKKGASSPWIVFRLLANPTRWRILHLLLDRPHLCGVEIADALNIERDAVRKQLGLMVGGGLLRCELGEDRRFNLYSIPDEFVADPKYLEIGPCRVRLDDRR